MKPADLEAVRAAVRGELLVALPAPIVPPVPADLDLEAGVIAARWDGALVPLWFGEQHFYADANAAIWCAVDAIVSAGHTPTPSLIRRAIDAAGARVPEAERYALDVYARPVGLDVFTACRQLRELLRRRVLVAGLRATAALVCIGQVSEVSVRLEVLRAAWEGMCL
jgi:hypothetical protein